MSTMITEACINCAACEPECPNTAIYAPAARWELNGESHEPLSMDYYYIVPEKCTECVGHFDQEQCAAVCPVDCCVPNPDDIETEEQLYEKAKRLHPEKQFASLSPETSRFQRAS